MKKFSIVTDGSVTFPSSFRWQGEVAIAHDHIGFGVDSYTPEVDLTAAQFYDMLRTRREHPTTSQPSLGDVRDAYEEAVRDGERDVLVITVDRTRSGTYSSMSTSAQSMQGNFVVVDSRSVSGGLGMIVMACVRARQEGRSFEETVELARSLASRVQLIVYIDTLEFLRRSGRVPAIRALLGSLLRVKPILKFAGGEPEILDRVRTRSRGAERVKELATAAVGAGARVRVFALHTNAPEEGREIGKWARENFHCLDYYEEEAGPVLATHVGPGVFGLGLIPEPAP